MRNGCKKVNALLYLLFIWTGLLLSSCGDKYEIEGDKVYWINNRSNEGWRIIKRELEGVDVNTFEIDDCGYFATDRSFVYFQDKRIEGADAETFEFVEDGFGKDKDHGIYRGSLIVSSDAETFAVIGRGYARDSNDIYFGENPLNSCNPPSFKLMSFPEMESNAISSWMYGSPWAGDDCKVYHNGKKVPTENVDSLVILNYLFSKDPSYVFSGAHRLDLDYKGDKIIDTVDAPSFKVISNNQGYDKYGCIEAWKGRFNCTDTLKN